jgi:hypothetical protein
MAEIVSLTDKASSGASLRERAAGKPRKSLGDF